MGQWPGAEFATCAGAQGGDWVSFRQGVQQVRDGGEEHFGVGSGKNGSSEGRVTGLITRDSM